MGTVLGGAALILFWGVGQPLAPIPMDPSPKLANPALPTMAPGKPTGDFTLLLRNLSVQTKLMPSSRA